VTEPANLRTAAREIFETSLSSADPAQALRNAVHLNGSLLTVRDTVITLDSQVSRIYSIAVGKAAPTMAAALSDILGNRLTAGVISGPAISQLQDLSFVLERWQFFKGGHPLPNSESLNAAKASFDLLKRADQERALVLFLISGGGSAMLEWPIHDEITLEDLRRANQLLVSCGASIAEINAVRRAVSAVKGGRLAAQAPNSEKITLIISDTNAGDEASVASGPTIAAPANAPQARAVVANYPTLANLPSSILQTLNHSVPHTGGQSEKPPSRHYVLLDNHRALEAAAVAAGQHGFVTEIALNVVEAGIEEGCRLLLSRLEILRSQNARIQRPVCLISGGEFLCPVRANGVGGRNAETVLRWAIEIDRQRKVSGARQIVVLSAGTDGIDGNSPAAGAVADDSTLERARSQSLDAQGFLETSDAFSFFDKLGDAIVTGATGTNVRDVRILLAH